LVRNVSPGENGNYSGNDKIRKIFFLARGWNKENIKLIGWLVRIVAGSFM